MSTFSEIRKESDLKYLIYLCFVAALGGILYGFDTIVISGTIGFVSKQFSLDEMGLGWYVGSALVGSLSGAVIAGFLSDYLGRKKTQIIAAILFTVSAIGCCLCRGMEDLIVYRIIGGVGIGITGIVSPIYISEIAPAKVRGMLVGLYQFAVTMGILLAYLTNFTILSTSLKMTFLRPFFEWVFSSEIWRGMLGSESLITVVYLLFTFTLTESPRWLMLRGKYEKARKVFRRLRADDAGAEEEFMLTKTSIDGTAKGQWKALKEKGTRRAVLVGTAVGTLGQFMGMNSVLTYGPQLFCEAGLISKDSLFFSFLIGVVNMITTVLALFIIDKVGRKKLIYYGVTGIMICLVLIGCFFTFGERLGLGPVVLLVIILLYIFAQSISVCAVVFVILSEMFPNRVRGLAMSIATFVLGIANYLVNQFTPLSMSKLTIGGTFFLFAFMCLPYLYVMWKKVPETTGKTLEEIEEYWKKYN